MGLEEQGPTLGGCPDETGGNRIITWGSIVVFGGGKKPIFKVKARDSDLEVLWTSPEKASLHEGGIFGQLRSNSPLLKFARTRKACW